MRFIFTLIYFTLSLSSHAKCRFEISPRDVKVKWLAYKTPRKVAVQGEFKRFTFNTPRSEDMIGKLKNATFNIDSSSVSTGNSGRDKKIVTNFFTEQGAAIKIAGKFYLDTQKKVMAELEIDGVSNQVPFHLEKNENSLILTSDINVIDFSLKENLSKINLACKALHEGVTWPDVKIMIEIRGKKRCD